MASIEVEIDPRGAVVVVAGDIDMTLADELTAALDEAAGESDVVVVDLAAATLLDSRAIGILLDRGERLRLDGRSLALAGPSDDVRRLFSTLGLEREFTFAPDREAALAA